MTLRASAGCAAIVVPRIKLEAKRSHQSRAYIKFHVSPPRIAFGADLFPHTYQYARETKVCTSTHRNILSAEVSLSGSRASPGARSLVAQRRE